MLTSLASVKVCMSSDLQSNIAFMIKIEIQSLSHSEWGL
jgi:hypothetical protein